MANTPTCLPLEGVLAWNYLVQLREEILSLQNIRARLVVAKTVFVSAGAGAVAAYFRDLPALLLLPALAAICFDTVIDSYTFSIKRNGSYIRLHLEPVLRQTHGWSASRPLWEEFMAIGEPNRAKHAGNWLLTVLATTVASVGIWVHPIFWLSANWQWPLQIALFCLLGADFALYCGLQRKVQRAETALSSQQEKPSEKPDELNDA